MSLDSVIEDMIHSERMLFPYAAAMSVDASPMVRCGLMIAANIDMNYPSYRGFQVRRIINKCSPEYFRPQSLDDPVCYAVHEVRKKLFYDKGFQNEVLSVYYDVLQPELTRYRNYNSLLESIDRKIESLEFDDKDWSDLADLYQTYKSTNAIYRYFVFESDPLHDLLSLIYAVEELYGDLAFHDLKGVPKSVCGQLGMAGYELNQNQYGLVLPYLHMRDMLRARYDDGIRDTGETDPFAEIDAIFDNPSDEYLIYQFQHRFDYRF